MAAPYGGSANLFDPYSAWLGIDGVDGEINHYHLLGLEDFESDATKIVEAADRQMSRVRVHQTGARGQLTQALLNQIAEAKICLTTLSNKQVYDRHLQKVKQASAVQQTSANHSPVNRSATLQPPITSTNSPVEATSETISLSVNAYIGLQHRRHRRRKNRTWQVMLPLLALIVFACLAVFVVWFVSLQPS